MPIDATKPADGVPASKGDLRTNLQAAQDGIATKQTLFPSATTPLIDAAAFGDAWFLSARMGAATTITARLGADVPAGKMVEIVRYGAGNVTAEAQSATSATLVRATGAPTITTEQYQSLVFIVDTNTGTDAAWRQSSGPPAP